MICSRGSGRFLLFFFINDLNTGMFMRENSPKNIGQCQLGDNIKIEKKKRKMSKKEEGKTKDYEKLKLKG